MRLVDLLRIHAGGPPAVDPETGVMGPGSGNYQHDSEGGWQQTGPQKGTNEGGTYTGPDGAKYYVKFYKDVNQGRSEVLANEIYRYMGIHAPMSEIVKINGKEAVASKMIQNLEKMPIGHQNYSSDSVKDGFLIDAWLGNHDVVGLEHDNMYTRFPTGNVYRIDNGGSLFFRAQGGHKAIFEQNPNSVPEVDSMRNPNIAKQAGPVFKDLTESDLKDQAKSLVKEMTPQDVHAFVHGAGFEDAYANKVETYLNGRLDSIAKRFQVGKYKTQQNSAFSTVDQFAQKKGFEKVNSDPMSKYQGYKHPKGFTLEVHKQDGGWSVYGPGVSYLTSGDPSNVKNLGKLKSMMKDKQIVTTYKKQDWDALKAYVGGLNTKTSVEQAIQDNPAVKSYYQLIDEWKSGNQQTVKQACMDYVNSGGKTDLPASGKLLLKAAHMSPPLDYPLQRIMQINSKHMEEWMAHAKSKEPIKLAPMGYTSNSHTWLEDQFGYKNTWLYLDKGSTATNVTKIDSFNEEREHVPSGMFIVKSAQWEDSPKTEPSKDSKGNTFGMEGPYKKAEYSSENGSKRFVIRLRQAKTFSGIKKPESVNIKQEYAPDSPMKPMFDKLKSSEGQAVPKTELYAGYESEGKAKSILSWIKIHGNKHGGWNVDITKTHATLTTKKTMEASTALTKEENDMLGKWNDYFSEPYGKDTGPYVDPFFGQSWGYQTFAQMRKK